MRTTLLGALLAATAVLASAPPAPAADGLIQPGDRMVAGDAVCTTNFVFDGLDRLAGEVFLGTAAHCVAWIGQPVQNGDGEIWGEVAKIGVGGFSNDWALVRVAEDFEQRVSPMVKGHPGYPTGYTVPADTDIGDLIQISGFGTPFGAARATQEGRVAVMNTDNLTSQTVAGPITTGDSGGPLVHVETGTAMGIVSQLCTGCPGTQTGPTVQGILGAAAAADFPVVLRTVRP
jgi:hypothetical protein